VGDFRCTVLRSAPAGTFSRSRAHLSEHRRPEGWLQNVGLDPLLTPFPWSLRAGRFLPVKPLGTLPPLTFPSRAPLLTTPGPSALVTVDR